MINKFAVSVLALLLLVSVSTQVGHTSFTGSLDALPHYIGFPQPYNYIIDTNGTNYFAYNGTTGYLELQGLVAATVIQAAIDQIATIPPSGGDVMIRSGTFTSAITLKNNVRLVLSKGTVGITVSIDAGATCILEDYCNSITWYYSAGVLVMQYNNINGLITGIYSNFHEYWSQTLNRTDAVVNPTAPYSYIVDVVGSVYRVKNGTTGQIDYQDTNASAVLQPILAENKTIVFKSGNYPIDYMLPAGVNNLDLRSETKWGAQFTLGANGGFNRTSITALQGGSFRDFQWMDAGGLGAAVANYGITSYMPSDTRSEGFEFVGNKVSYFRKAGTIFLNLTNPELNVIENNYFYRTRTAFIQFLSNGYESGNNKFLKNVCYFGYDVANENAIRIVAVNGTLAQPSQSGHVYSWGNQFFGSTYDVSAYAWNETTTGTYCTVRGVYSTQDRYEGVQALTTQSFDSGYGCSNNEFSSCDITTDANDAIIFVLDGYTTQTSIHDNHYSTSNSNVSALLDLGGTANRFYNNKLSGTYLINASKVTIITGNYGYSVGIATYWRAAGGYVSPFGSTTNTPANLTVHGISSMPCYINATGGVGINAGAVNFTITDNAGNILFIDVPTITWFYMPVGYSFYCTYNTAPTMIVEFIQYS